MRTLYVATRNPHKVREIQEFLDGLGATLATLPAAAPEVEEDGLTFRDNAIKKAESAAGYTGQWALADDSGLEVDALGGAPSVRSARYAGIAGDGADAANNRRLLERLAGIDDDHRQARFRCVIALARPGAATLTFDGAVEGQIVRAPRGDHGFGYDPLFYHPLSGCTFAELPLSVKNRLSHRAEALTRLRDTLTRLMVEPVEPSTTD